MKIGLYFGSFNPVHIGHLIIAEYVHQHTDLKQIWFVVSPQNPLKPSQTLLNEYDRLNLVNVAIEENDHFRAVDIEFKLPKPSYTINTLSYLQEKYPQHDFTVIMGSDSYLNLPNWKNYQVLIENYSFVVYQRPGFLLEKKENTNNRFQFLNAPFLDISATFIRKQIALNKSVRYLVPDKVFEEIESCGYYK